MNHIPENLDFRLIYVIVNSGAGSKVLHIAKQNGMSGGTIFLGSGTKRGTFLEILALNDIRREIVLMAADSVTASCVMQVLNKELKLSKPNHGIAFSIPIAGICGSRSCSIYQPKDDGGANISMYQSIIIIVDKGKGEEVVETATSAGATGATIINARGSGIHETSKLFAMEIEPEKEIVLIISPSAQTGGIVSAIRDNFQIDLPGKGIIFVQNVAEVYGLFGQ